MSQERDLEKDIGLAHRLGQLPDPQVPADLAARIAAKVTQMPQHPAEPEAPVTDGPPAAVPARLSRPSARRFWLPYAIGGAIAATAVGAVLLQPHVLPPPKVAAVSPPAVVPVPAQPKALPDVMLGAEIDPRPLPRIAPTPPQETPAQASAAPTKRRTQTPAAQPAPAREIEIPMQAEAPPAAPAPMQTSGPTEQASVVPAGPGAIVGPMLPAGPATGLSITGSGPRSEPGGPPAPGPRGPRF